jgi:hypothetical protein
LIVAFIDESGALLDPSNGSSFDRLDVHCRGNGLSGRSGIEHDDSIDIGDDDVPREDRNSTAGDRNLQLAELVSGAGHRVDITAVYGQLARANITDVPITSIDHDAGQAADQGGSREQFTGQRGLTAVAIDHHHIAR